MICPLCRTPLPPGTSPLYQATGIPVRNNVVHATREAALAAAVGDIELVACPACGFVRNRRFDPAAAAYDPSYDASRAGSAFYRASQAALADALADGLDPSSSVLEIGCGQGELLAAVCDRAGCRGLGVDPGLPAPREAGGLRLTPSLDAAPGAGDVSLLIMQHVLEHLPDPRAFLTDVLPGRLRPGARVHLEVPSLEWIVAAGAWFDLTYEHCNYFTAATLAGLARTAGMEIEAVERTYGGQYLTLTGRYTGQAADPQRETTPLHLDTLKKNRQALYASLAVEDRLAIWGASGKGVIFLGGLPATLRENVVFAVDVNPAKQGRFLPASAVPVKAPEALRDLDDMVVLIMNPAYEEEIRDMVRDLGLGVRLRTAS